VTINDPIENIHIQWGIIINMLIISSETIWPIRTKLCRNDVCDVLYKNNIIILFYLCPSVLPSVQDIFRHIFLSNCWWQKSDIWSQASYRYTVLWVAFLDPSDSYFLFADLIGFYTHWTCMHIFRHIFLSNYWWQKSDIWSQASYRYLILWEAFLDPSDSCFLFADLIFIHIEHTFCICPFLVAFFSATTARTARFSKKSPWSVFFRGEMSVICHKMSVKSRWNFHREN
jgi:hypothetical protein